MTLALLGVLIMGVGRGIRRHCWFREHRPAHVMRLVAPGKWHQYTACARCGRVLE